MNTSKILAELRAERARIESAIQALEALEGRSKGRTAVATQPKKRRNWHMSAAARKRQSERMKARWAARRKGKKAA